MKNTKQIIYLALLAIVTIIGIVACEEQTETYSDFTKDGEIIYIGTPDTVFVAPGFEKLQFSVVINSDPKISKGVLQTKDKSFIHEFDVLRKNSSQDTVTFTVNLDEGEYNFDLLLKDDAGNTSIPREVSTVVYGNKFQNTLTTRDISSIKAFETEAVITWNSVPEGCILTSLTYEDASGILQTIEVPNDTVETTIANYKVGGQIVVESGYVPTTNAIELFKSEAETMFPDKFPLDYSRITALQLPFDASGGCYGSTYEKITDGAIDDYWTSCETPEDIYPFVMSFDIGVTADIRGFRIDELPDYTGDVPKAFQIWATNDLTGAETVDIDADEDETNVSIVHWEADAIAKGWVKLLDVTDNTQGTFEIDIPEYGTSFRYIRVVAISSISGDNYWASFNEFTFIAGSIE